MNVTKYNAAWADQPRDASNGQWTVGGNEGDGGRGQFSHTEMLRTAVRAFGSSVHSVWNKLPSEARSTIAALAAEHLVRQTANLLTGRNVVPAHRLARAMGGTSGPVSDERIARAVGARDLQNHLRGAFGKSLFTHMGVGAFDHLGSAMPHLPNGSMSGAPFADAMYASRQFQFLTGKALSDYRAQRKSEAQKASDAFHQRRGVGAKR